MHGRLGRGKPRKPGGNGREIARRREHQQLLLLVQSVLTGSLVVHVLPPSVDLTISAPVGVANGRGTRANAVTCCRAFGRARSCSTWADKKKGVLRDGSWGLLPRLTGAVLVRGQEAGGGAGEVDALRDEESNGGGQAGGNSAGA